MPSIPCGIDPMGVAAKEVLPVGYTRLHAIGSQGNCLGEGLALFAINSWIASDTISKVFLDVQLDYRSTQYTSMIMGAYTTSSNLQRFHFNWKRRANSLDWDCGYGVGTYANESTGIIVPDYARVQCAIDISNRKFIVNNSTVSLPTTFGALSYQPFTFFARKHEQATQYRYGCDIRLFSAKIWQNNILTHDYIPVRRDNDSINGLFDLIERKFLKNELSSNFIPY